MKGAKIKYAANFLCLKWDSEAIQRVSTSAELIDELRSFIAAATIENASSCSLLVIGAFIKEYLRNPEDCDGLKAYLQSEKAFAGHQPGNKMQRMHPAYIRSLIEHTGDLCGGAGYGFLLSPEQLKCLGDEKMGVGIRNLSKSVDLVAWSSHMFGQLEDVVLAVGTPKSNAYWLFEDDNSNPSVEAILIDVSQVIIVDLPPLKGEAYSPNASAASTTADKRSTSLDPLVIDEVCVRNSQEDELQPDDPSPNSCLSFGALCRLSA